MSFSIRIAVIAALVAIVSGCTWVKIPPEAKEVAIVPAKFVADCRKIGVVSANTADTLAGIPRARRKIEEELDLLAKEQAAAINANTLVRKSMEGGTAAYTAYYCE
jgi:hypothetical protein